MSAPSSDEELPLREKVAELQQLLEITCEALESSIETIRMWHGVRFVGRAADDPNRHLKQKAWGIYRQHAPEMKRLDEALEKAKPARSV